MKNLIKECKENALQAIQDYSENQNLPENWVTRNEYQRGIAFACNDIMKTINQITLEKYNLYRQTAMGSMKDRYIHDMRNMVTREVNAAIENLIEKGSQRETAEDVNNSVAELVAKEVESIMENDQAKENPPETTESKTIEDILNVAEKLGNAIIETMTWYRLKQNREDEIEEQEKREAAEFHEQKIKEYLAVASEMKKSRHEQEALDKTEKEEAHNFIKKLMGRRM